MQKNRLCQKPVERRSAGEAGAVAAILLGGFIASQLVREFFGCSTDRNQFLVYVDLPAGYRLDSTNETVQRLNAWLTDKEMNPEITDTVAYVGLGGPRFFLVLSPVQPIPHVAFLGVSTEKAEQVPDVMRRIRRSSHRSNTTRQSADSW